MELCKQLPGSYDGELVELRDRKIKEECWDDPMFSYALQFSQADKVLIAAMIGHFKFEEVKIEGLNLMEFFLTTYIVKNKIHCNSPLYYESV